MKKMKKNKKIVKKVKINGVTRLKQPLEARITVDKQESTPENKNQSIKMMIGEEEAAEKNGCKKPLWIVTTLLLLREGA
jgi:hypothetical protein